MEKLFSTQYLHILRHRTTHQTLELQWLDFVPSSCFRASIEELMRLARKYQAQALIADNRHLRALRQADLQWSGELVFQNFGTPAYRRLAVVDSFDAMNRMGVTALESIRKIKKVVARHEKFGVTTPTRFLLAPDYNRVRS